MDLVEVDHLDAEPPRALAPVLLDVTRGRRDRHHLRREERFLASIAERFADDAFGVAASVDLRGVDHVHTEIERAFKDARGFDIRVLRAVAPVLRTELPRTQSDHRQPISAYFDVSHNRRLGPVTCARARRALRCSGQSMLGAEMPMFSMD